MKINEIVKIGRFKMKMNKTMIIGIVGFAMIVLALGVFLNLKDGRDTGLVKLKEEIKEGMEFSLAKEDSSFQALPEAVDKEQEELKEKSITKVKAKSSSSYNNYYVKSEPQYIKNLQRSGIEVKKREEMTAVSSLVTRHMEKEGFPNMEESFTKEFSDNYIPGRIIVKRAIYRDNGEYSVAYDTIEINEGQELQTIALLEGESDIVSAEPDVKIEFETSQPSDVLGVQGIPVDEADPGYTFQWGLDKIAMLDAWEMETGDNEVNIAVIDTGADLDHEDLAANIDLDESYDYVNNDDTPDDDHIGGHGTHVAGIIAAVGDNDIGGNGVMWKANLIIFKVLDEDGKLETSPTSSAKKLADAISDAIVEKDARIINMSSGTETDFMEINVLEDAFEAAFAEDVLIVAAAGNDEAEGILYPAKYDGVLCVAATDINDKRSAGTAYGAEVDIAAPGKSIYSTTKNNSYGYQTGTSMSAAFVSGVAGLLLSKDSSLNKLQLKMLLLQNADDLASAGMGEGRLNAKKALEALKEGVGECVARAYVGEEKEKEITVDAGEEVQFYGEDSECPDGVTLSYQWDFGDGETSDEENPTHTYAEALEDDDQNSIPYSVLLVVSAGDGYAPASDDVSVTVEGGGEGGENPEAIRALFEEAEKICKNCQKQLDYLEEACKAATTSEQLYGEYEDGDGDYVVEEDGIYDEGRKIERSCKLQLKEISRQLRYAGYHLENTEHREKYGTICHVHFNSNCLRRHDEEGDHGGECAYTNGGSECVDESRYRVCDRGWWRTWSCSQDSHCEETEGVAVCKKNPVCGDSTCDSGEDCNSCLNDCGCDTDTGEVCNNDGACIPEPAPEPAPESSCGEGDSQSCACGSDSSGGTQVCKANGEWGKCSCPSEPEAPQHPYQESCEQFASDCIEACSEYGGVDKNECNVTTGDATCECKPKSEASPSFGSVTL